MVLNVLNNPLRTLYGKKHSLRIVDVLSVASSNPWLVGPLTSYLRHLAKIISAWWLTYPSEKYESQLILFIIPNMWRNNMFQTTNQILKSMQIYEDTQLLNQCSTFLFFLSLSLSLSPHHHQVETCQVQYFNPSIAWHKPLSCILKQLQRYVPTDTLATRLRKGCLAGYCNHTLREAFFSVLYLSMISCITLLPRDTRRVKTYVVIY